MIGLGMGLVRGGCALSRARRDLAAYSARLAGLGKVLSPQARAELLAFATALYENYGRLDFLPCRADHNVGSGSTLYSFQGAAGTLTSGPTWTDDGIAFGTTGSVAFSTADAAPFYRDVRSGFCVFNSTRVTSGYDFLMVIEGGAPTNQYYQHQYSNVAGENATRAVTTRNGVLNVLNSNTDFQSGVWLSSAIRNANTATTIWEDGVQVRAATGLATRNPSGAIGAKKLGNLRNGTMSLYVYSTAAQDLSGLHAIAATTLCKEQIA